MILSNIPSGLTLNVTLYARNSDNSIGAEVDNYSGTYSGATGRYTFNLAGNATGDFWCKLTGASNPDGAEFPVRNDVAYFVDWDSVERFTTVTPTPPSPIAGMCNLLVSTTNGAGSRVWAKLADTNNTADQILVGQQVVEDTTDSDGNATLVLIQYGQFTAGGTYRIRVADTSRNITHNVLVRMPNTSSANLEDLTPL